MASEQSQSKMDEEKPFTTDGDGGGVASTTATSSSDTADVKEHAGGVISIEDVVPSDDEEVPFPLEETGRNDVEDSLLPIPGAGPGQEKVQEFDRSDPVVNLIYWRDIKKTAVVFTSILLILFSLICHSVISVAAYAALAILTVTVGFRLYRLVLQTLNGTQQPHPFQAILDVDLSLSPERAEKYASVVSSHVNCVVSQIRDLLLVKATLSSLKFGVCLWLLTYIGALFNGLTLLIIDVIFIFTVPPVYEKYQVQIDGYYGVAKDKMDALVANIKAKMPGKKEKTQ